MKFAPLVAGSALAALLVVLGTAKAIAPPEKLVPLSLDGVDTLEVRGDFLTVVIDSKQPAELRYLDRSDSRVKIRRDGSRLIIDSKFETYGQLGVTVPGHVRRFVVSGGSIIARERLREVEILSPEDFSWMGDVDRLLLRDTADASKHRHDAGHDKDHDDDECSCGANTISVNSGRIGELRAWSPHATLSLGEADTIGVVHADLGAHGAVSVSKARRFDHIHLLGGDAAVSQEESPQPPPSPH